MATFSYKLTNLQIDAWFPPNEPLSEPLVTGGSGTYTVSIFGTSIGYYLELDSGTRMNPLRLGQPVRARGTDPEGKPVVTEVLETTGTGTPASFKGPYHAALGASPPAPTALFPAAAPPEVRLATSSDIVYRAYARPYEGGPGQVISLFASCSYPTGQWQIFFEGTGDGAYRLMERVPGLVNYLITYYAASFTNGFGLATPVTSVVIEDARGRHTIPVEPLTDESRA